MVRELQIGQDRAGQDRISQDMPELLARIESALQRAEVAAERLRQRHRGLRSATRDTLTHLDRLIDSERTRSHG